VRYVEFTVRFVDGESRGPRCRRGRRRLLFGYLLTYLATADTIRSAPATQVLELLTGNSPVWKLVGWTFYGGHFVDAVVAGYLPLAVVGVFAFTVSIESASAAPDLAPAVLLAGVVYPLVFGTLGGAARGALG
jgi:hypothetical protein